MRGFRRVAVTAEETIEDSKASHCTGIEDVQLTLDEMLHAMRRAAVNKKARRKYVELVREIPEASEVRYGRDYDVVSVVYPEADILGDAGRSLSKANMEVRRISGNARQLS